MGAVLACVFREEFRVSFCARAQQIRLLHLRIKQNFFPHLQSVLMSVTLKLKGAEAFSMLAERIAEAKGASSKSEKFYCTK